MARSTIRFLRSAGDDVAVPLLLPTHSSSTHHHQLQRINNNKMSKGEIAASASSSSAAGAGAATSSSSAGISRMGLFVLMLLAFQNCGKNLVLGYVMKDQPEFLTSTAVLSSECLKLILSSLYILFVQKQSFASIVQYLRKNARHTLMLIVPAMAYNLQSSLEYVALANINAAMFSVLVQTKLIFTAIFAALILGKRLRKNQIISLGLLTIGVMMCNMRSGGNATKSHSDDDADAATAAEDDGEATARKMTMMIEAAEAHGRQLKGILATLGISICSGLAGVYTEKFIKGAGQGASSSSSASSSTASISTSGTLKDKELEEVGQEASSSSLVDVDEMKNEMKNDESSSSLSYGLAYTQVQLAVMSILTIGVYALMMDWQVIVTSGLFVNFSSGAVVAIFMSATGGLIVASVLKYADSILKGYATALSVILTGVLSMILFHTHLSSMYFMGIALVVAAVILYNGQESWLHPYGCYL